MKKEDIIYAAGFIDGEGYIGIKKYIRKGKKWETYAPMYSEKVSVAGLCEPVIKGFNKIIRGYVFFHKPSKLSKRGYWSWELSEKKAKSFIKLIFPYLRVKKLEADLVLKLSENKEKSNSHKLAQKDIDYREDLYLQIKKLHTYIQI